MARRLDNWSRLGGQRMRPHLKFTVKSWKFMMKKQSADKKYRNGVSLFNRAERMWKTSIGSEWRSKFQKDKNQHGTIWRNYSKWWTRNYACNRVRARTELFYGAVYRFWCHAIVQGFCQLGSTCVARGTENHTKDVQSHVCLSYHSDSQQFIDHIVLKWASSFRTHN